jgi:hypothetical protein
MPSITVALHATASRSPALATYVDMLGVARRHHPPGWLHGWPA